MRRPGFVLGLVVLIVIVAMGLLVVSVHGQDFNGHGYLFAGPGGLASNGPTTGTVHFGGGAEYFLARGVALGAELGYLGPTSKYGDGFGVLSANGAYHVVPSRKETKLTPFITGGYSLGFRHGAMNMVNFGGGVTWWPSRKHGIRFEFRDHYQPTSDVHYFGFRVGWTFR